MKNWKFAATLIVIALAGCRGEPVPRDYQNSPPAVTHPVTSSSETPSAHGMSAASAQPSSGAEGANITRQATNPLPGSSTMRDQAPGGSTAGVEPGPPPQNSQHATQTTATAVTGTHLAPPP